MTGRSHSGTRTLRRTASIEQISGIEEAYRNYGSALHAMARRVVGNDADASDCVHDVLVRTLQRAPTYRPERGSMRTYLLVAVRNEAISRLRKTGRREAYERKAACEEPRVYDLESTSRDVLEIAHVRKALAALPPEQRAALELAYRGGLSHVEIAERLGEPLGTIKSRLVLGMRKLKAALS